MRNCSSMRRPRPANRSPTAANSSAHHPAPTASTTRPPDSTSSVATVFATSSGSRIGRTSTLVPRRTRPVAPAITASVVNASRKPSSGPNGSPSSR
jgi:hypothetical protein